MATGLTFNASAVIESFSLTHGVAKRGFFALERTEGADDRRIESS